MPNWCSTNITITGLNGKAKQIHKEWQKWLEEGKDLSDFKEAWLGSLMIGKGIGDPTKDDYTGPYCRGCLTDLEVINEDQLSLDMETAWSPMLDCITALVSDYPEAEITYSAIEQGNGVYLTNDADVIGKYYIDSWDEVHDANEVASAEDVRALFNEVFPNNYPAEKDLDILKLIDYFNENADDIRIHAWDYEEVA